MKYGYARVSTQGQSLADQEQQLKDAGVSSDKIYFEKFTGTTDQRPEFKKLKEQLKPGDELVVTKLDRLGRKTSEVISFLDECSSNKVTVNVLNMGRLDSTPGGKLMRNVISAFAEYERDMIVSRTQEGKAYAKKHNPAYREGRPRRQIGTRYKQIYEYSKTHSIRETAQMTGVSASTVSRIKKQMKQR